MDRLTRKNKLHGQRTSGVVDQPIAQSKHQISKPIKITLFCFFFLILVNALLGVYDVILFNVTITINGFDKFINLIRYYLKTMLKNITIQPI